MLVVVGRIVPGIHFDVQIFHFFRQGIDETGEGARGVVPTRLFDRSTGLGQGGRQSLRLFAANVFFGGPGVAVAPKRTNGGCSGLIHNLATKEKTERTTVVSLLLLRRFFS